VRALAWLTRLGAIVGGGALLLTAVAIGVSPRLWQVANAHEELPVDLPEFESLSQRTLVYDALGTVIAVFQRENSQPVALDEVPDGVVAAVLAVEDQEFFQHKGVNVRGLIRATLSNFSGDAPRQGASTITQQVVKNEFLAGLQRDGRYKLLQAHYALMLDKKLGKDEILERYLNTIFFGNNAYGLQAAAEVYFGKSVSELSMLEGAFLAGMIRSPSGYDPIRRPERARARFRQVVERLVDVGLVAPSSAEQIAEKWPIPEQLRALPSLDIAPSYYTEALRGYLIERSDILGATEQERANLLYRGGLAIHTTLDPRLQTMAEQARNTLPETRIGIDAALVSLDSRTGAVRAMVGGRGFVPRENEINMALVPRQTGSSIKLFILAAAVQAGAQADDLIDGRRGCILPNPGDPKQPFVINGGVRGSLGRLDQATWASLNCAYARLSQIVGLNRVVDSVYRLSRSPYLYRGQAAQDRAPVEPYASFATGANEMSPLDMASGAQSLANNGLHHEPYYVEWVEHADGTRLYTRESAGEQVLDVEAALTTTSILRGVLTKGTARRALADFPFPAAGKTGTQQDNTNSWFVGYTPELSTAVWVGDPDGYTPMVRENVPEFYDLDGVEAVQGGTYPARIWRAFQEPALTAMTTSDWYPAARAPRQAARLFLPGEECAFEVVRGSLDVTGTSAVSNTTTTSVPSSETTSPEEAAALQALAVPPTSGPTTSVPVPDTTGTTTSTSLAPRPTATVVPVVIRLLPTATTIAPDVLDPRAPLPSVPADQPVVSCKDIPDGVTILPAEGSP
jgi:membrane peptidoglycan carboxypeptidase